jgi:uncharacterized membrane protein
MIVAITSLVFDPVWPWSLPHNGWLMFLLVAMVLTGLTVLTYLVGRRANVQRFVIVLSIRLLALLIAFLVILRPAIAQREETVTPSRLIILVDASTSMNNKDEFNNQSRWERCWELLESKSVKEALRRLKDEQKVEIIFYQAAEKVEPYQPQGLADGKRTDIGQWLHTVAEWHGADRNVRGVIVLSDGADNGTTFPTQEEAKRLPFPLYTIGLGSPKTTADEKDIYFVPDSMTISPSPVPAKGKLIVKAVVNAPGFVDTMRPLNLVLKDKDGAIRASSSKSVVLSLREGNLVQIEADAPAEPGDYKVELKIEPFKNEVSTLNNEISSYVTVTKEGLSVLWVEGKKRLESTFVIRHVLTQDPKIRVYYTERVKENEPPPEAQKDWFQFDKQHYDVVVIGDISGSRFCGGDPKVFEKLEKLVKSGSGLLVLGGYESFANSDWGKYPEFTKMLPVVLDQPSQVEGIESVRVKPTTAGLDHYILKLVDDGEANEKIWLSEFRPLDGMTKIGIVRKDAVTLATDDGDMTKPVLAFWLYKGHRVVVFGGDKTWSAWRRSYKAIDGYTRFWKKMIYWLASKDQAGDEVWVKLDTRRLPAGNNAKIGFTVGLNTNKAKQHGKVTYKVKIYRPQDKDKDGTPVSTWPKGKGDNFEHIGTFWDTNAPGEYKLQVDAFDEKGKKINLNSTEAKFLTYAQDLEALRPAADHALLARLAELRQGQFRLGSESEVAELLNQLIRKNSLASQSHKVVWPDWNRDPISPAPADQVSALISSGLIFFYLLFCGLLCLEWLLRRQWNMV